MTAAVAWVALNVVKGIGEYRAAQQQADSMRFQGQMALIQGQQQSLSYRREELNAQKQANDTIERMMRANSAVIARAAAQNLQPFEGSPLDLQKYNTKKAGEDWEVAKSNKELAAIGASNALLTGQMQKDEYNRAASATEDAGFVKMLTSFGSAYMGYTQLGSAPAGGTGWTGATQTGFNPNATVGFKASMTDTYRWGR